MRALDCPSKALSSLSIPIGDREAPWFWGLDFFEWQGSDGPQYDNAATLEAAKQAFRAAWDRRPKATGKS